MIIIFCRATNLMKNLKIFNINLSDPYNILYFFFKRKIHETTEAGTSKAT